MNTRFAAIAAATLLVSAVSMPALAGKYSKKETAAKKNIVQVAQEAGSFNTLITAVKEAGLLGTLSGEGKDKATFTVFAPTDEAFKKLPAGALESLLKDKEALKNVLLYHVAPGTLKAKDVVSRTSLEMANGGEVKIDTTDGVKLNASNVVSTDILASNGVIHVIDTVLLP